MLILFIVAFFISSFCVGDGTFEQYTNYCCDYGGQVSLFLYDLTKYGC